MWVVFSPPPIEFSDFFFPPADLFFFLKRIPVYFDFCEENSFR